MVGQKLLKKWVVFRILNQQVKTYTTKDETKRRNSINNPNRPNIHSNVLYRMNWMTPSEPFTIIEKAVVEALKAHGAKYFEYDHEKLTFMFKKKKYTITVK